MHDVNHSAGATHRGRLRTVLLLVVALLTVELGVALATGSLALLSDAGHLATDVLGLSLALGAISVAANRPRTARTSFGWYRLEILAALANAGLLLGVAAAVLVGAIRRWSAPIEIEAGPLLLVASMALIVNLVCAWLLRPGADVSLNLEGARLEVLADAVGSIGVLIAAGVIHFTGWTRIDSIVALGISFWLLPRALRLARRSLRVLMQHAPEGMDLDGLDAGLRAIPGVVDVHDLHVWTLTSGMEVASLHVAVTDSDTEHVTRHAVRQLLAEELGIRHVTIQVERRDDPACCEGHPADW